MAQRNNCPKICGGAASPNECDPVCRPSIQALAGVLTTQDSLTYACVCINGTVPDVAAYKDTLPYYVCIANRDQCVANHPDDADGQKKCQDDAHCGTLDVNEASASTTSAAATTLQTASATATAKVASTTAAAATAATSTGAAALGVAPGHSTGLLVGALAALRFVL